jgi:retron-type reverse transcriptase
MDPVRALQHALYRAAKADPKRRFHALRDKIYRRDVLWRAWVAVRRNNGAPGIDKTTLAEVEEYGVPRLLEELASDLRDGTWRPLPARRVLIPKPGTAEQRPLSIPTGTANCAVALVSRGFGIVRHGHPSLSPAGWSAVAGVVRAAGGRWAGVQL